LRTESIASAKYASWLRVNIPIVIRGSLINVKPIAC
jgi:hypothetical protein